MEEFLLNDLIDQFLQGTISPEDHQKLQQLMTSDPAVRRMVEDSQLAYKALELERRKQLKTKLKALDGMASGSGKPFPKWLRIGILLLGACLFYWYMASVYFSPESIAERNYISYQELNRQFEVIHPQDLVWQKADEAFKKGDYQNAIQQFAILSESINPSQSAAAKWNILLAQFAMQGPSSNWKISLESFERSAPEVLSEKARELIKCLESGYYRFFMFRLQDNFSTIKPRLI